MSEQCKTGSFASYKQITCQLHNVYTYIDTYVAKKLIKCSKYCIV